jgi:hypothetical protein
MRREHVWVGLGLPWLCAPAFRPFLRPFAIREVLEPYLGQSENAKGENEKKSEKFHPQPWVDQVGFGSRMTRQTMKRIDTFGLVSALDIYMGDITLISVLKDKAEKRRREKVEKMG